MATLSLKQLLELAHLHEAYHSTKGCDLTNHSPSTKQSGARLNFPSKEGSERHNDNSATDRLPLKRKGLVATKLKSAFN